MKNLLLNRLANLKREDLYRFESFIRSPYFHKGEKAAEFMDIIQPFYPNFDEYALQTVKEFYPSQKAFEALQSRINDLLDEFELYELFAQKNFYEMH